MVGRTDSLSPCLVARRLRALIAAFKSLASFGKLIAFGCTVVSTVTRLRSLPRNAPVSYARRRLSASSSSSSMPSTSPFGLPLMTQTNT